MRTASARHRQCAMFAVGETPSTAQTFDDAKSNQDSQAASPCKVTATLLKSSEMPPPPLRRNQSSMERILEKFCVFLGPNAASAEDAALVARSMAPIEQEVKLRAATRLQAVHRGNSARQLWKEVPVCTPTLHTPSSCVLRAALNLTVPHAALRCSLAATSGKWASTPASCSVSLPRPWPLLSSYERALLMMPSEETMLERMLLPRVHSDSTMRRVAEDSTAGRAAGHASAGAGTRDS